MQGGWINKDPYSQLPGFGDEECKKIKHQLNGKALYYYCTLPVEERKQIS